jgi:uncharacterized protein DUF2188
MARRTVVHVTPSKREGGWDVKKEGGGTKQHFETKPPAVEQAKHIAKDADLGQVKIHKEDGTIQTEHTYGKDPEKSPG